MIDALTALALPALPALSRDGAMLLTVILALATLVVAGRAVLLFASLRARARAADRLSARLEAGLPTLEQRAAAARQRIGELNAATEQALWSLPSADRRLAVAAAQLAELRAELDAWCRPDGRGVGRTLTGIRGTLRVMNGALRLRRMIQR
ncbi:MAG TPA: hypothetical protein VNT28_05505 [Candidatus Limnocylindrales bacterium]|nr:hypothetical protein [Candidatus Limnocylindrales bacterium]